MCGTEDERARAVRREICASWSPRSRERALLCVFCSVSRSRSNSWESIDTRKGVQTGQRRENDYLAEGWFAPRFSSFMPSNRLGAAFSAPTVSKTFSASATNMETECERKYSPVMGSPGSFLSCLDSPMKPR